MISRLTHISIPVLDQDSALDFYVNKLGLEVRTDHRMDNGVRWLIVGPKGQPDMEIVLIQVGAGPMMDEQTASTLRDLVTAGTFRVGVWETPDCRAAYEELKAKGVRFLREPKEQFYGIEALLQDDSGNLFSLTQRLH
jgi:catechol 2,3-dioxygenase-like lactoylglutathione lyase family enzyme